MNMSLKERALKCIANEKRREILRLLEKGDKSFSEIQAALGIDKGSLRYHMKELVSLGLVANIYERKANPNPRLYSYYKLTSFGAFVMDWYRAFKEAHIEREAVNKV